MVGAQASTAEQPSSYSICHQLPLQAGAFTRTRETWKRAQKAAPFQTQPTAGRIETIRSRVQSNVPLHGHGRLTESLSALLMLTGDRSGQTVVVTLAA